MILPMLPIWIIDFAGSSLMILFSFLCVHHATKLRKRDEDNIIWTYLIWVSYALVGFAISRGVGHIAKILLMMAGRRETWDILRPFSGGMNTLMFALVGSTTLFFKRVWRVYQQMAQDKAALEQAHEKLLYLNRNLEDLVAERSRELVRSETKYRRIFEASRDMIAITAGTGKLLDMNPAGKRMLGIEDGAVEQGELRLPGFFARPEDWEGLREQLHRHCYVNDAEIDLVTRDGRELSVLLSASAECEISEKTETFHFVAKDISQRKVMQQQLLQADKLASIGQLAAGIAHEINNPLSIILGYTQLLIRDEPERSEKYADLRTIEKHARTCKIIVEDLLSFSRTTHTRKETASLHDAIDEVLNVVHHHLDMDRVNLVKAFDPDVPSLVLDRNKIKQVFMNLIMNAKQAIAKEGEIRIRTRYVPSEGTGGVVYVDVEDTGCGIQPKDLSRIFDPFFTTKSTGEGTGLGLSVSYGIVKNHGGDILVQSEPGKGSTFTVVLPVTAEDEAFS
jgi:PAS domain S-box-containing protein